MPAVKKTMNLRPQLQQGDMFLSALQALPEAVFLVETGEGNIAFANHAAQMLTGKSPAGKSLSAVFGPDSFLTEMTLQVRITGQTLTVHDVELCGRQVQGLTVIPEAAAGHDMIVVRYDELSLYNSGWVERIRQGLRPAQHLARLLAHEIKNPLSGIRGAAQLLRKTVVTPDDRELVDLIENETGRILRLVKKVGVFDGEGASPELVPVNIHAVLDQVVRTAKSGFGREVAFDLKYDPSLPEISGAADDLIQVFLNLVRNAAEAEGVGRRFIILRTGYALVPQWHPETHEKLPVCVYVEDNGAGISQESLMRIFDPYYTTKKEGDGLGLAIVSQIVDSHGGIVDVSSAPGRTVFKVCFPLLCETGEMP